MTRLGRCGMLVFLHMAHSAADGLEWKAAIMEPKRAA